MILAVFTALWLGFLTSISPCPLATNVAAISFISKNIECPIKTIFAGLAYTFGRILTYVVLGVILISGLLAVPSVANFLQEYINKIIGPLLVIVGVMLLGVFKLKNSTCSCKKDTMFEKFKDNSIFGAMLIGIVFALSFCPTSAALFFGSLSTLAIEHNSRFLLPLVYGIGTGLPVVIFGVVIAFAVHKVGEIYHNVVKFELYFRKITGVIFIVAGIYFVKTHYFGG